MFTVADMMTPHPHTLTPSDTLADAKRLMTEKGIHHVPVTDQDNHLLGLISQRDILSAQESSLAQFQKTSFIAALDIPLKECMHTQLFNVEPQAGLKAAALYMQKHNIGCLPVLHHNKLVGIITDSDFVAIAINLLEIQEDSDPPEDLPETDHDQL